MERIELFEDILEANELYVASVNGNLDGAVQLNYLKKCQDKMRLVLENGLGDAYKKYCDQKILKHGKLF